MRDSQNKNLFVRQLIFVVLGIFCFLYSIFDSLFAEIHVNIPFVPFPIFIGEILLAGCLGLLFLDRKRIVSLLPAPVWITLMFYLLWLFIKVAEGYYSGGSLALRHAALFYYPLFAFIGFLIWDKKMWSLLLKEGLLIFLGLALIFIAINDYFVFIYLLMIFGFVVSGHLRVLGVIASLAVIIHLPHFNPLVFGSRSHLVGLVAASLFLFWYFVFGFCNIKLWIKLLTIGALSVGLLLGVIKFSDKNAVKSLTTLQKLQEQNQELAVEIKSKETEYKEKPLKAELYHPNSPSPQYSNFLTKIEDNKKETVKSDRPLDIAYDNIFFRLFIWKDMILELIDNHAWWGMSLGHPLRSPTIEMLDWASGEWRRDGWIAAHNSFLHMIYRAGVLGIVFVLLIFVQIGILINKFLQYRSLWGGLLLAGLVYWIGIGHFLVFLELPYNAIPFWSLLGMTWGYLKYLEDNAGIRTNLCQG